MSVPSSELGPPTPSPASECVPSGTKELGGHTRLRGRDGGFKFGRLWEEALHSVYSVVVSCVQLCHFTPGELQILLLPCAFSTFDGTGLRAISCQPSSATYSFLKHRISSTRQRCCLFLLLGTVLFFQKKQNMMCRSSMFFLTLQNSLYGV